MNGPLRVVVGIIENTQGEILIAQRHAHAHQGGRWEFPGGKIEAGESARQALVRELQEELGIQVSKARPGTHLPYRYPDLDLRLEIWKVDVYEGQAEGKEGQRIQWQLPAGLTEYAFPEANQPILRTLCLPRKYRITDDATPDQSAFLERLERSLQAGIRLVQLRVPALSNAAYLALAVHCQALCQRYQASLLLNADPEQARSLGQGVGVHLNSRRLLALKKRPLSRDVWVAASCHNAQELQHALRVGVDFVVLSPVNATPSHPNARLLGWHGFAQLLQEIGIPVYALGGVGPEDLASVRALGGYGVAGIRKLFC